MSLEFRIGGRVVCVKANGLRHPKCPRIEQGSIYTISAIVMTRGGPGLHLEECPLPRVIRAWAYDPSRFRPVRETSIDCFTALLAKPPVRQKANA